uniref:ubiquitinyl hydrolase 1 n=1 Tax=Poecilia reticulata TaxID=8081 RepID=A0A3P9PHQ6_POERE
MDSIFHEKQEGSLCAQHCLNNLLQGEYFTPVDLSSIAHQLDEEERMRMAEGGMASEEYRTFLQQPSGNMDDSGFFSIQWFNLNSLLTGPELISDTYLALFLAQLQQEGYSIFVIRGNLPECEAEQILGIMRVHQQQRPRLIGEDEAQTSMGYVSTARRRPDPTEPLTPVFTASRTSASQVQTDAGFVVEDEDEELKRALALSRQDMDVEDEEADVRRAIQLSMQGNGINGVIYRSSLQFFPFSSFLSFLPFFHPTSFPFFFVFAPHLKPACFKNGRHFFRANFIILCLVKVRKLWEFTSGKRTEKMYKHFNVFLHFLSLLHVFQEP